MKKNQIGITNSGKKVVEFNAKFIERVDKVLLNADSMDKDFLEGIRLLDEESKKSGLSFYEVVYDLTAMLHSIEQKNLVANAR